ncbi:MAG: heme exporter protein CcmD [Actinomycetota bacterium]
MSAYVFTAVVLGTYLASLVRRHRVLRRRVADLQAQHPVAGHAEEGATQDAI